MPESVYSNDKDAPVTVDPGGVVHTEEGVVSVGGAAQPVPDINYIPSDTDEALSPADSESSPGKVSEKAEAGEFAPATPGEDDADAGPFDPGDHTVAEVNEHLATADEAERKRVLSAERRGKGRSGVVG